MHILMSPARGVASEVPRHYPMFLLGAGRVQELREDPRPADVHGRHQPGAVRAAVRRRGAAGGLLLPARQDCRDPLPGALC